MISSRRNGFSMVENLVALFIASVGILGMAGLQAKAMHDGGDSILRTRAVNHVADMVDRMRLNPGALDSYVATLTADFTAHASHGCSKTVTVPASECTPVQMAQYEMHLWKLGLANTALGLPSGQGSVTSVLGQPGRFFITVQWTNRDTVAAAQHSVEVQF